MTNLSKDQYWEIRNKSEKAWNDALASLLRSESYAKLKRSLDELNAEREATIEQYFCTYKIHPDDEKIANFKTGEDGSYIDTLYRCGYFRGEAAEDDDSEFPFPMPGTPKKFHVIKGIEDEFHSEPIFAWSACFNCHQKKSELPTGFYCSDCMANSIGNIRLDGKFDTREIEKLLEIRLRTVLDQYREELNRCNRWEIDDCIEVKCDTGYGDEYIEVMIRLILDSCEKIKVCAYEDHDFPEGHSRCTKCNAEWDYPPGSSDEDLE